jgi:hypothetical protein
MLTDNEQLVNILTEMAVPYCKLYLNICLERLNETTKGSSRDPNPNPTLIGTVSR